MTQLESGSSTATATVRALAACALTLAVASCSESDAALLGIDARGAFGGTVYVDRNGNGLVDATDGPLPNVAVRLIPAGRSEASETTLSREDGAFVFLDVPVGRYQVAVDPATIPDSLRLTRVDSAAVTIAARDTSSTLIELSYPKRTVAEARSAAVGSRMFVEGVSLNAWPTFGDSTLHIRGATGAIRAVRVEAAPVAAGDSLRLLATRSTRDGQPVLQSARAFVLGAALEPPQPVATLSTGDAATASNGDLDAELVRVAPAAIVDTASTPDGDLRITIDDGSSRLDVLLDRNIGFIVRFTADPFQHRLGATGVLVPASSGRWTLKPRARIEIQLIPPPNPNTATGFRLRVP